MRFLNLELIILCINSSHKNSIKQPTTMKNHSLILLIIPIICLVSCATSKQYTAFSESTQNETSKIYVIRDSFVGQSFAAKIYNNNELVGDLGNKSFLCWESNKSTAVVVSKISNSQSVTLNMEAGKTYYLKQSTKVGLLFRPRTEITQISEQEGIEMLAGLKKPTLAIN
jgi:hypothetical protein